MNKTALLVIDVQNIYADPASPLFVETLPASLKKINALIEAFTKRGQPVIYVRHVHRPDGRDAGRMFDFSGAVEPVSFVEGNADSAYIDGLLLAPEGLHITKRRYSCFEGTELDGLLRSLAVTNVAICGYMTNFCCDSTARAAHDRDYFVDFLVDATGAPALSEAATEAQIKAITAVTLGAGFARIQETNAYLQNEAELYAPRS